MDPIVSAQRSPWPVVSGDLFLLARKLQGLQFSWRPLLQKRIFTGHAARLRNGVCCGPLPGSHVPQELRLATLELQRLGAAVAASEAMAANQAQAGFANVRHRIVLEALIHYEPLSRASYKRGSGFLL